MANGVQLLSDLWQYQFVEAVDLIGFMDWFKATELWPKPMPENYLSLQLRPVGFVMLLGAVAVFLLPNTQQYFARFEPVLNMPRSTGGYWAGGGRLDLKTA